MSDITQGQDAPNDDALFREALEAPTLEKFENAEPLKPAEPAVEKPAVPQPEPKPPEEDDPPVPSGRLREATEARRRAERERDELMGRLRALEEARQPQQQQPPRPDLFENPSGFVQEEIRSGITPLLQQLYAQQQRDRENYSHDRAVERLGEEKVNAAYTALSQGIANGDPSVKAVYDRAMQHHDPYGLITKWHMERETLNSIGGNLDTYKQRLRQELMNDPEFRREFMGAQRNQAASTGASVARPAQASVPTVPSLSSIGAGGTDEQVAEPSDDQLFRAAVSAKRR